MDVPVASRTRRSCARGRNVTDAHRRWVLEQRKTTDLVIAHFLMDRMSPQEAMGYMKAMEDKPDTRYPPLVKEKT